MSEIHDQLCAELLHNSYDMLRDGPLKVLDEESVNSRPRNVKDRVLVQMYEYYELWYVDPVKCSNKFDNILN